MSAIPLVDLKANYKSIKDEVDKELAKTIETCYFVNGPEVAKFEKEFSEYTGTDYCIGCNSGTDALILALKSLGIGEGDEVITQANTFVATILAVSHVGALPVLVDVGESYMMDADKVKEKITSRTKAVIVVHLYGLCADMDAISGLCKDNNLLLVEDCAQASGTYYKGKHVGGIGDLGCYSFYPGKNLGAFGDGGAIVTNNSECHEFIKAWRNWGSKKKYYHEVKGGNSRLDTIQAAVLSVKLKHLDTWNDARRSIAEKYKERLTGIGDLILPTYESYCTPSWHLFVVRTQKRDELLKCLHDNKIYAGIHYPVPLHKLTAYEEFQETYAGKLPNSEKFAAEMLSLPIFPELTDSQIDRVCITIANFYKESDK